MPTLPPAGVSAIGADGEARDVVKPARRRTNTAHIPSDDPLMHADKLRKVNESVTTPAGTRSTRRDIREGSMPRTRTPRRHMASFDSVDGNTYTFRTHQPNGKPVPYREIQCLYLALVEVEKGGLASTVFDAFRVTMPDANGVQYYPIPEHLRAQADEDVYDGMEHPPSEEEEEEDVFPFIEDDESADYALGS